MPEVDGQGPTSETVFTVTELNQRARLLLERSFARVSVVGEVSGRRQVSGHFYFTLKDEGAQLPAVLFRGDARFLKLLPQDGIEVVATGRLTVYPPQGRYQLVVERLEARGAGALQIAFEKLKEKLAAEGLFAQARKRSLPLLPRRVAVVTSPTGAVIRDVVHVATRRLKGAHLVVFPTRVQGEGAAREIAAALGRASELAPAWSLDVIILARGGGSLEDLWAFNEEVVARAIVNTTVPVVSGVGHETDVTIADFAADVRAPTPSAAAELVFPLSDDLLTQLGERRDRLARAVRRDVELCRHRLAASVARLPDARGLMALPVQRLAAAEAALERSVGRLLSAHQVALGRLETRLARLHPQARVRELFTRIDSLGHRLRLVATQELRRRRDRLQALAERLAALSPLGVLTRGYAIVLGPDGAALCDAQRVAPGDALDIRLARGRLAALIQEVVEK